jgi:hypothetical protein
VNLLANLTPIGAGVVLLALSVPAFTSFAAAKSFGAPLKKKGVDYGPSPSCQGQKLSCYFYRTFMVKGYDTGQKGAEWLAIVPIEKGVVPACDRSHVSGERVIEKPDWAGYFKGAKGNLVFFNNADGTDGGLPFVVYDTRTGQKIFDDSAYDSSMWSKKGEDSPFNQLRVSSAQDGQLTLRYLRVVKADCDLHTEMTSCWEQVRKKLALKGAQMPVCSGYKGIPTRWASAVAYPVEVLIFLHPAIKTITGPVK